MTYGSDALLFLVDLPNTKVLLSANTHERLGFRKVSHYFYSLSVYCEPTVELLQLSDVQQAYRPLAHAECKEFLETTISPNVPDRGKMKPLVEDLPIERWDLIAALSAYQLHRSYLLGDNGLVLCVSQLTLLEDLLQQSGLAVALVDAEGAIR